MSNKNPKSNENFQNATQGAKRALTDVNYVTLSVNHDITVVPVLDLKDIACDRVCCH